MLHFYLVLFYYCFWKVESLCINDLLILNICHFSSKKSLSSFPESTLKNITTPGFFTYESIKVSNIACINRELNLFCFSKIRYRNNKTYNRLLLLLSGDITHNLGPINVLSSITMISGLFLKREVFILCILTSIVFYQKLMNSSILLS